MCLNMTALLETDYMDANMNIYLFNNPQSSSGVGVVIPRFKSPLSYEASWVTMGRSVSLSLTYASQPHMVVVRTKQGEELYTV